MNKYQEAIDIMARYISDCKIGIKRYADREIDSAMVKIVELKKYCDELEHEIEVLKDKYNADQKNIEDFDTTNVWYWKKVKRLEKSLDKACKKLASTNDEYFIEELGSFILGEINRTKEEWEEWLMNEGEKHEQV